MTVQRYAYAVVLALTVGGLILLQALIGGARLVEALPGYLILGIAGIATIALRKNLLVQPRLYCLAAALILSGYVIVRALVSPVPQLARADIFTALASLAIYLVGSIFLGGNRARFASVLAIMVVAVVQVCVGIWQFKDQANFMPQPWIFRPDYGFKASGFFIDPNHFATLLGMLGMLSLSICCWGRIGLSARAFAFYGFIVCLTGTALTGSRGGYISIAMGLLFFTAASIFLAQRFQRPHFFGLSIATALVLTAIVAIVLRMVVQSEVYEKRLRHVQEPGGKARLLSAAALAEHRVAPIFGTGAGTFLYFGRQLHGPAVQSDPQHAHDDFLELLAEYGWVGAGLAGLFLLAHGAAAIGGIWRVLEQKLKPTASAASNELALLLGATSALGVALVHALMDFPFHLPAIAIFAAFLFSILANSTVETSGRRQRRLLPLRLAGLAPAVGLVLLVAAIWRLPAEWDTENARLALRDDQAAAALDDARRALAHDSANPDARYYAGEALHYLALDAADPDRARELREQAEREFAAGLRHFPQDVRLLLKLGRTLDDLGKFNQADPIFQRALAAAPNSGIVQACVGLHYHRRGNLGRAEQFYRAAQALGETQLSSAGLNDLVRDQAAVRENDAFANLLPDPPVDVPPAVPAK